MGYLSIFLDTCLVFSIFIVLPIRLALEIKTLTLWLRLDVYVYLASYIADVPEYDRRVMDKAKWERTRQDATRQNWVEWHGVG